MLNFGLISYLVMSACKHSCCISIFLFLHQVTITELFYSATLILHLHTQWHPHKLASCLGTMYKFFKLLTSTSHKFCYSNVAVCSCRQATNMVVYDFWNCGNVQSLRLIFEEIPVNTIKVYEQQMKFNYQRVDWLNCDQGIKPIAIFNRGFKVPSWSCYWMTEETEWLKPFSRQEQRRGRS